jgi:hypothetical protein
MKSIYSIKVLQRILDHWGIGKIEDVTYFDGAGRNIWRHYIDTNQGEFELYSYPAIEKEYAERKLQDYLEERHRSLLIQLRKKKIIHSFDRYHVLLQLTKKHQISVKQASTDLDLLIGSSIQKAFRVYGTIFQMHLDETDVNKAGVLVSYGSWSIQDYKKGRANVLVDSRMNSYDQLDNIIELVEKDKPIIEKYILKGGWFELYLSNGMSLHFWRADKFPAIEVHLNSRRNDLLIFEENELFYTRDFRDK